MLIKHKVCMLIKHKVCDVQWNLTKLNGVNAILRKWPMFALYCFWPSLLHMIDGACIVCALQSTLAAVCFAAVRFAASPQHGFFFLLLFLRPLGVKAWCGLYPPGALEVGVNTLVRSREGSREASLHVGSRGIASGLMQGHIRGWGASLVHQ